MSEIPEYRGVGVVSGGDVVNTIINLPSSDGEPMWKLGYTGPKMRFSPEDGAPILRDAFCGVGIETDQGLFGIAQRDGGIEVMLDGELLWSSTSQIYRHGRNDGGR